jgi:hypothetical protein
MHTTKKVLGGFLGGLAAAGVAFSLGMKDDEHAGHDHGNAAGNVDMQAGMEAWMKSMTPGENHKWLEQFVGEWETTTKMWMSPGAPAQESSGAASCKLTFDGRFLEEDYNGTMMGMPFKGRGITGYDNNRKLFKGVWYDTFGTGMMTSVGNLSKDRKTLTMLAEMDEPMTGEIGKPVRYQVTIIDNNTHKFKMDEIAYGEPFTVFEITYTRKK